jgi:hypothetical protein
MAALMRPTTIFAGVIVLWMSGCAQVKPAPSASVPQESVAASLSPPPSLPPPSAKTPVDQAPAPEPAAPAAPAAEMPAVPSKGTPPALASQKVKPRAATSSAKPATAAVTAGPAIQPSKQAAAAQTATPDNASAAPTLDLAQLEQRLRDTHAIGVLTKLSLKNQVDDLLNQFRSFYRGEGKTSLPDLRQRYNLLLLKVLSLLQDGDAQLAAAILSSREAIWGILADPDKFAKI